MKTCFKNYVYKRVYMYNVFQLFPLNALVLYAFESYRYHDSDV